MINRIVKLHIKTRDIPLFIELFASVKERIVAFEGCHSVTLLQDNKQANIIFTYSLWDSEADLNAYRESDLFIKTWKKSKTLFDGKPEAWSTTIKDQSL